MISRRTFAASVVAVAGLAVVVLLVAGSILSAPSRRTVGEPPPDLRATSVRFESSSGATIAAWFGPPEPGQPVVVLSHGVRGARDNLTDRARFLRASGFGVLLYDAQAHGESSGDRITFGFLEAHDARAAVAYVAERHPSSPIGFIGPSLAGAAAILEENPLAVDALVLEAVYATLEEAVFNRLALRLSRPAAHVLTPLLMLQVEPRLGFDPYALNPVDRIGDVRAPVLVIAGARDRRTPIEESRRLFDAAPTPKELWVVEGAGHESFHRFAPREYEARVTAFFVRHLKQS